MAENEKEEKMEAGKGEKKEEKHPFYKSKGGKKMGKHHGRGHGRHSSKK